MWRLLFLSSISALVHAGCSDDCGPGGAPEFGLVAGDATVALTYGNLSSGANNDCPDPAAPAGVISLTISGSQMAGTGLLTLCVPRPDLLGDGVPLGTAATNVRIIDMTAELDGCQYLFQSGRPVTGTASADGICDNGTNKAGYALTVDGNVSVMKTCPASTETIALNFAGTVEVKVP